MSFLSILPKHNYDFFCRAILIESQMKLLRVQIELQLGKQIHENIFRVRCWQGLREIRVSGLSSFCLIVVSLSPSLDTREILQLPFFMKITVNMKQKSNALQGSSRLTVNVRANLSSFCLPNDRSLIGHGSVSQGLINIHDSFAKDTALNVYLIGSGPCGQTSFYQKNVKHPTGSPRIIISRVQQPDSNVIRCRILPYDQFIIELF